MPLEEEVFQTLKSDSNGLTTKVSKKLGIFGHNKFQEKKENKFLIFRGSRKLQKSWSLLCKCWR